MLGARFFSALCELLFIEMRLKNFLNKTESNYWLIGLISALVIFVTGWWWQIDGPVPILGETVVYSGNLQHPAQVIRLGDRYFAGELFSNELVLSESLGFENHERLVLREKQHHSLVTPGISSFPRGA